MRTHPRCVRKRVSCNESARLSFAELLSVRSWARFVASALLGIRRRSAGARELREVRSEGHAGFRSEIGAMVSDLDGSCPAVVSALLLLRCDDVMTLSTLSPRWCCPGSPKVLRWCFTGAALVMHWSFTACALVVFRCSLVMYLCCIGTVLVLRLYCLVVVSVLYWSYSGALVLL